MKNILLTHPYLYLGIIIAIAVGVRIALPYTTVFGDYIKFISPDCYFHMGLVTNLAETFPVDIPDGRLWSWLLAALAWLLAGGNPSKEFVETVVVFVPPAVAGVTIYFIYLIGSRVFSRWAGVIAAGVIAFIPGEFFGRSVLGAVDHHVAEVFFTTGVMAFIVLAWRVQGWRWWLYTALGALFLFAYASSWMGYHLFIMLLGAYALVLLLVWLYRFWPMYLSGLALILCTAMVWVSGIPERLYSAFNMSPLTLTTTTEAVNTLGVEGIIGLILPKCILALLILLPLWKYKVAGDIRWLLVIWTLVMVGAALWQRRFDYYLVVPLSILIGFVVLRAHAALVAGCTDNVRRYCNGVAVLAVGVILSICLVITLPGASSGYRTPSSEWHKALTWVRDNTPEETVVITWWDYGWWVKYIADRESYVTGGQGEKVKEVAELFNAEPGDELPHVLYKYRYICLIIDNRSANELTESIRIWDGGERVENSLVKRLYEGSVKGFELVYDSEVKVYIR